MLAVAICFVIKTSQTIYSGQLEHSLPQEPLQDHKTKQNSLTALPNNIYGQGKQNKMIILVLFQADQGKTSIYPVLSSALSPSQRLSQKSCYLNWRASVIHSSQESAEEVVGSEEGGTSLWLGQDRTEGQRETLRLSQQITFCIGQHCRGQLTTFKGVERGVLVT